MIAARQVQDVVRYLLGVVELLEAHFLGSWTPFDAGTSKRESPTVRTAYWCALRSDGYRLRKQDGRYFFEYSRLKTIPVFFPVFSGIPAKRISVYLGIPDNRAGCMSLAELGTEYGATLRRA